MEDKWFAPSPECSSNAADDRTESLSLHSFWSLYIITGATSTVCFLLFLFDLLKKYWHHQEEDRSNATPSDKSVWNKTVTLARYLYHGEIVVPEGSPTFVQSPDVVEWSSSRWEYASPTSTAENLQASSPAEIEIVNIPGSGT